MIGFVQDISNQFKSDSNIGIVPVSNFDYIECYKPNPVV